MSGTRPGPRRRVRGKLVVVGDALLDRELNGRVERISPEGPVPVVDELHRYARPGGAGLAAALAAQDGYLVRLITALADDAPGRELAALLAHAGVEVIDLGLSGRTPEKVRIRVDGQTLLRLDRSAETAVGEATSEAHAALAEAAAVLVSDYGHGVAELLGLRSMIGALPGEVPVVWDPHRNGASPVPGMTLVTPNRNEAAALMRDEEKHDLGALTQQARHLRERWRAGNVCITLGPDGALLVGGPGPPLVVPARRILGGDPCGAGDRFASYVAGLLADGALVMEAVAAAVEPATAFVAAGGAAQASRDETERAARAPAGDTEEMVAAVRGAGGTVVAAGGCFDLLHAGHVQMLQAARALGDCLIVCLNSDESVRRLKGPGRPVVSEEDRVAVLEALDCVDGVIVFEEDTPESLLERLRPELFAKGGDYAAAEIPEAAVVERWGGQVVIVPYVPGRSTSELIDEVANLAD